MNRVMLLFAASLVLAGGASAQDGAESFLAETLRPASDGEGILNVESGAVAGHLEYDLGLWLGYAHSPFRVASVSLITGEVVGTRRDIIESRFGGNVVGAIGLFDYVQVGVDLPFIGIQAAGPETDIGDLAEPATAGIGDLRLIPKVRVLRAEDQGLDLALVLGVTFPTAQPTEGYLGEKGFTFVPELTASKTLGPVRFAGNIAIRLREDQELLVTRVGSEIAGGVGIGYRLHDIGVPVEIDGTYTGGVGRGSNRGEVAFGANWDVMDHAQVFAAFGVGGGGFGTPLWRAFGGLRWSARAPVDADGDGVIAPDEQCPDEPEDKDGFEDTNGCPDLDNDGDGVLDGDDRCADEAEDKDGFEDEDGCPDPDNDRDGVLDGDDKCPLQAGPAENGGCPVLDQDGDTVPDATDKCPTEPGPVAREGCPVVDKDGDGVLDKDDRCVDDPGPPENQGCPDTDKDGVIDPDDRCPNQPGPGTEDGCPKEDVNVTREAIEIPDKVYFGYNKSTLQAAGYKILKKVADVLQKYTYIKKVQIGAHTDLWGSKKYNKDLAARRAKTVKRYLVKKGVDAKRLEIVDFGMDKPAVADKSAEASAKNRRVEFTILEQDSASSEPATP